MKSHHEAMQGLSIKAGDFIGTLYDSLNARADGRLEDAVKAVNVKSLLQSRHTGRVRGTYTSQC